MINGEERKKYDGGSMEGVNEKYRNVENYRRNLNEKYMSRDQQEDGCTKCRRTQLWIISMVPTMW